MLIVMDKNATDPQVDAVIKLIEDKGFTPVPVPGTQRTAIGIVGNSGPLEPDPFLALEGVKEAIPVSKPYKMVSREFKKEDTVVKIGEVSIGGGALVVMAGPCAVESLEQCLETARAVKAAGAHFFRAGAYKPRTSPYSFQGLEEKGLEILRAVREETG